MNAEDAYLRQFKVRLLKEELNFWEDDQKYWPVDLNPELFDYYFNIETLPMVIDLETMPIERQPFDTGL